MMMRAARATRYGTVGAYGIIGGEAAVDEVEGPGLAVLVFRLEVVRREEGRRGGGADRDVRQECIFRRPVLQLIGTNHQDRQHGCNALIIIKKSPKRFLVDIVTR